MELVAGTPSNTLFSIYIEKQHISKRYAVTLHIYTRNEIRNIRNDEPITSNHQLVDDLRPSAMQTDCNPHNPKSHIGISMSSNRCGVDIATEKACK